MWGLLGAFLPAGKWVSIRQFHISKTVATRRAASIVRVCGSPFVAVRLAALVAACRVAVTIMPHRDSSRTPSIFRFFATFATAESPNGKILRMLTDSQC